MTNASTVKGEFAVADSSTSTVERALLIIIVDGGVNIGFFAPRTSVRREDAVSMGVDEFSVLPIRATFLKPATGNLFTWINADLLNPTGT